MAQGQGAPGKAFGKDRAGNRRANGPENPALLRKLPLNRP